MTKNFFKLKKNSEILFLYVIIIWAVGNYSYCKMYIL